MDFADERAEEDLTFARRSVAASEEEDRLSAGGPLEGDIAHSLNN